MFFFFAPTHLIPLFVTSPEHYNRVRAERREVSRPAAAGSGGRSMCLQQAIHILIFIRVRSRAFAVNLRGLPQNTEILSELS
jgi:hypothetical protein